MRILSESFDENCRANWSFPLQPGYYGCEGPIQLYFFSARTAYMY